MSVLNDPVSRTALKPDPKASKKKPCVACGYLIPLSAAWCKECRAPQSGEACRVCGAFMPRHASVCNTCKAYQDWRRRIPGDQVTLALIAAILSVLGAVLPKFVDFVNLPSRTSGFFLSNTKEPAVSGSNDFTVITVRLVNEGGRPAQVERAKIDFGSSEVPPIEEFTIVNRENMVVPGGGKFVDLKLYARELMQPMSADAIERLANDVSATTTTITVSVRERSRVLGELQSEADVTIKVPAATARDWVYQRLTPIDSKAKEKE